MIFFHFNSRAIVFCFPKNLQRWFTVFITSTLMSVIIGAIFWDIQSSHSEQEDINDRIALHYVLATVSIWPTLLLMISDIWREKNIIAHDTKDRLYGRFAYFVSKVSCFTKSLGISKYTTFFLKNVFSKAIFFNVHAITIMNERRRLLCKFSLLPIFRALTA